MTETHAEANRLVAYKITIGDITEGKYNAHEGYSPANVMTPWGLRVSRARILATVTAHYLSEDGKYAFVTLDDGTGVIRSKAFQNTEAIAGLKKGDIIDIVGRIRQYSDERYLMPEIVRVVEDFNMLALRKLEYYVFRSEFLRKNGVPDKKEAPLEEGQEKENHPKESEKQKMPDEKKIRQIVMEKIGALDQGEGVDYSDILKNIGIEESLVEKAIDELLGEGSCYEPRAGKLKVL